MVGGININLLAGGQVILSRDPVSRAPLSGQVSDRCVCFLAFVVIDVGFLAPAANLDESSIAHAVEKDLTTHLIPCLLGIRECVMEFVEQSWEWMGHFYTWRVEVRSHEPTNGTFCITCLWLLVVSILIFYRWSGHFIT